MIVGEPPRLRLVGRIARVMPVACSALAFAALAAAIVARHGAPFRIDVTLHEWSVQRRGAPTGAQSTRGDADPHGVNLHLRDRPDGCPFLF